jgi:hypothetical protein
MKKLVQTLVLAVGVLWAFSASGNAQVSQQYTVHVPFDFNVGSKLMKSGDYTIAPLSGTTGQRALILRNRETGRAKVIGQAAITSSYSNEPGRMTFAKEDGQWILQEVISPGFELRLRRAKAYEGNVASNKKPATKTVILGR